MMNSHDVAKQKKEKQSGIWYSIPVDEVLKQLGSSSQKGMDNAEAKKRLVIYGSNEIETEPGLTRWQILIHQFKDPLIYILLGAAFVTVILQDYIDSGVIVFVVILNALVGYIQETKAQSAIRALSTLSAPRANVIRNGRETDIPSHELVPGDIALISSGGRISADMRVIHAIGLEMDESALTGESAATLKHPQPVVAENPVPGDQKNMLFSGTTAVRGRGKAVVVRTGLSTELGKIATSVRKIGITKTPLQEKVEKMGRGIGYIIVVFAIFIAIIGIWHKMNPSEVFITVVAMVVSAIPEGLPVVLTITLAIGVRRMAGRQAVIRSLPAIETLGSTTVIGSDKTGTLTQNQMTVRRIWADDRYFETTVTGYLLKGGIIHNGSSVNFDKNSGLYYTLLAGTIANEANAETFESGEPRGDPTEIALHVSAFKGGIGPADVQTTMDELDILPFEPENKFMATLNRVGDQNIIFLKGAPEAVIEKCTHQLINGRQIKIDPEAVRKVASKMASDGFRVLAMAFKVHSGEGPMCPELLDSGLILAGLQGMEDPIRPEVIDAVNISRKAGIRVIMITGDHLETAISIGRKLGLDPDGYGALEGSMIDQMSDEELDLNLTNIQVFARVTPQHKLRIVERLKKFGHIVAVTGDGVNDAPALRMAHLGIAMGKSGTDVAREASDMILSDDNFATITAAIEEGRIVFSNIRKVTFFLLSTAAGEMIVILIAVLMYWPLPFIAVQILWINLVTNGLQDAALAFEPGEPGILKRKPRPANEGILTRRLIERLGGVGVVLATGTLGMFWWAMEQTGDLQTAQTVAMTQMVFFQFFHVLNCRSLDRSIFKIPFFSNKFLFVSLSAALLAHIAVLEFGILQTIFRTVSLNAEQWSLIVLVSSLVIIGGEIDKIVNRWRKRYIG
jgi:calcium-translocating P-type ATPase